MRGKDVFYPMGWDDNGLPTSAASRITTACAVTPHSLRPEVPAPEKPSKDKVSISRKNFVELCVELTAIDEQAFKNLWRSIGVSVTGATSTRRSPKRPSREPALVPPDVDA